MIVGDLVSTEYKIYPPYDSSANIVDALAEQQFVVVMDKAEYLGILTVADFLKRQRTLLIDCLIEKPKIACDETLKNAMSFMEESSEMILPVFNKDDFCGVLSYQNIFKFLYEHEVFTKNSEIELKEFEAMKFLAAGIGHDFNNIITSILGNIVLTLHSQNLDAESIGLLQNAEKGLLSATTLARQLLMFSGKKPAQNVAIDIKSNIRDSIGFFIKGTNIQSHLSIDENCALAKIDLYQFCQVMQNLILNALHAMPQGGVLKASAHNCVVGKDDAVPLEEGNYIKIILEDTGVGIEPENISRIFDPYFSTKSQGTGLGLAVVNTILKKYKGYIQVQSEKDKGSAFEVYIPATFDALKKEARTTAEDSEIMSLEKKGKVLVMDDDKNVLATTKKFFEIHHNSVDTSEHCGEAIELFKQSMNRPEKYNLIILDLTIPGEEGGRECAQEILKYDPEANLVLCTGHPEDPVAREYKKYGFKSLIVKPFDLVDLKKAAYSF